MLKRTLIWCVVLLLISAVGSAQDISGKPSGDDYPSLFDAIWQTVNDKFFDPGFVGVEWNVVRSRYRPKVKDIKDDRSFHDLMRQMLGELPVSHLTLRIPRQQGDVGVGIHIKLIEGKTVVVSVSPGSDAQAKGIRPGDVLLKPAEEFGGVGSVALLNLKGCDGRQRKVRVRRESHIASERPSIRWRSFSVKRGERIGYIRAVRFDDDAAPDIDKAMRELGNSRAIIIDARDNGGGNMSFIRLTSYFSSGEHLVVALLMRPYLDSIGKRPQHIDPLKLPRIDRAYTNELIFTALRNNAGAAAFYSEDLGEKKYKGKVVVLINEETESAAEGFAWHAKLKTDATLIGKRTPGILLGAEYFDLPGGWNLGVPTQAGWGPDGKPVIDDPVSPHIETRWTINDVCTGRDPDMAKAIEVISRTK